MEGRESGRRPRRKAAAKTRGMDESPRKCTFVLSAKLDTKISSYAKMRGINRSAALAELLEEGQLGSVVVSFRGGRGDAAAEAAEAAAA